MKSKEFSEKVFKQEIKNGTIFDVISNNQKIGQVGVIRTSLVYLDFINNQIPTDLLVGNYEMKQVEGE